MTILALVDEYMVTEAELVGKSPYGPMMASQFATYYITPEITKRFNVQSGHDLVTYSGRFVLSIMTVDILVMLAELGIVSSDAPAVAVAEML